MTEVNQAAESVELPDLVQFQLNPALADEVRDAVLRRETEGEDPISLAVTILWLAEALKRDFPWMAEIVFDFSQKAPEVVEGVAEEVIEGN